MESNLMNLERKFWQSMVDQDVDSALSLLCEPAVMVSTHGSMKFDHAGYRKMAEQGTMVVRSFALTDMEVLFPNDTTAVLMYHVTQTLEPRGEAGKTGRVTQEMIDTSTWVQSGTSWLCAMHTEAPAEQKAHAH
ncbi:MAG: nuclear transport factor 2 family protein [Burkholderiales bacterium]